MRRVAPPHAALRSGDELTHAEFPRQAYPAADPDTVLRVDPDLFAATLIARRSRAGDGGRGTRSQCHRADPQAIPARSAYTDPIRLLGQGRPVRRLRRVAPHQGAGARPDRAKTAGNDATGVDGNRHRAPDRNSRRYRLGGEKWDGLGLSRPAGLACGHLDSELPA